MKVRFLGFSFESNVQEINIEEYVQHIINQHNTPFKIGEHERFLFINTTRSEKYYVGLVVTVKDQKTFCELIKESGKMTVRVKELEENSELMDFNFFVLNKKNGIGMYQYYHQSFSVSSFGTLNSQRFSDLLTKTCKEKLDDGRNLTTKQEEQIKKKYKGRLIWELIVRKEKLQELIAQFRKVKAFEYCLSTLTASDAEFQPLKQYVNKERTKLSFDGDAPVSHLAKYIDNIVTRVGINSGKVVGIDDDGNEQVLRIMNNPDSFGEYEYDDVAPRINSLNVSDFHNSWVIEQLLIKCKEYSQIFEAKIK